MSIINHIFLKIINTFEMIKFSKKNKDTKPDTDNSMKVITTLYTGDEQPDYKIYPSIDVSERWFDNFDRLLYERIKQVKNSIY